MTHKSRIDRLCSTCRIDRIYSLCVCLFVVLCCEPPIVGGEELEKAPEARGCCEIVSESKRSRPDQEGGQRTSRVDGRKVECFGAKHRSEGKSDGESRTARTPWEVLAIPAYGGRSARSTSLYGFAVAASSPSAFGSDLPLRAMPLYCQTTRPSVPIACS